MSVGKGSFFKRVMRAIAPGSVPSDASQCDGPCIVHAPAGAMKGQRDGETDRQSPIRWVSLR
jgi:hypothetical protein